MSHASRIPAALASLLLFGVLADPAAAISVYTNRAAFQAAVAAEPLLTTTVVDWDGIAANTSIPDATSIDDVTYSTSSGIQKAIVQTIFIHSSPPNGLGQTPLNYFPASDSVTFSFATPIKAFAIDISTFAKGTGSYTATTNLSDVIDSYDDPFTGIPDGQFIGFMAGAGEGPYTSVTIASAGQPYVLDSMRYAVGVPTPDTDRTAFPGAFGYGAATLGALACAETPVVLTVDTLADDETDGCDQNACTFREAITHPGPAFVNFNVAGTIPLDGWLQLLPNMSCKTVSGATAPGDGVTIANESLGIGNGFHDLIVRYLRIRPGVWEGLRGTASCNQWDYRCDNDVTQDCLTVPCRCSAHERGEYESECLTCPPWDPNNPDDWTECNDELLNAGGVLDSITIYDSAWDLIFDHMSLTWAMDETIDVASQKDAQRISVLNSIIGWGFKGDDPAFANATREDKANRAILFGGIFSNPDNARTITQFTFGRNFIGGNRKRAPKHSTGNGVEYVNNIFYNNETVVQLTPYKSAFPLRVDLRSNVFRLGPDDLGRPFTGYCASGTDLGRACESSQHCAGAAACDAQWPYFIDPEWIDTSRGELFMEDNLFLDGSAVAYVRPYTELDGQWEYVNPGAPGGQGWLRPRRIEDADQDTWWDERRTHSFSPRPWADSVPIPPSQLATTVLPSVGASLPVVDAVDAGILDSWTTPVSWAGPSNVYPNPTATPWQDTDLDGLDDAWELVHFGNLAQDPLDDPDGDAYLNVEEWMNGSDPNQATWGPLFTLFGAVQGGQVSATVLGVQVSVVTTPGESPTGVLLALAAAIEADPTLLGMGGVSAEVSQNTIILDQTVEDVAITDPGLRTTVNAPPPPPPQGQAAIPSIGPWGLVVLALGFAAGGAALGRRSARKR